MAHLRTGLEANGLVDPVRAMQSGEIFPPSARFATGQAPSRSGTLALDPAGGPVQPTGRRCPGCRGLVIVDETTHRAHPGPTYYQLGQVSKFVAPGAVRIGANTFVTDETLPNGFYHPTVGLDAVAFVNPDGENVLVTYNSSRGPIRFALSWHRHALLYRQPTGATTTFT
jgi:glucosylceramidase